MTDKIDGGLDLQEMLEEELDEEIETEEKELPKKLYTEEDKIQYRQGLFNNQRGVCPLCDEVMNVEDGVLDHHHGTGHCRQVICNMCNVSEGKIKKVFFRFVGHRGVDFSGFLRRLADYLEVDYTDQPLHTTHRTELQLKLHVLVKNLKKLKRVKLKKQRREEATELRREIKEEKKDRGYYK